MARNRLGFLVLAVLLAPAALLSAPQETWTSKFDAEPGDLGPTGRNPFFVLEPGYQLTLEDGKAHLVITVLNETRTVDGVETRIVEERETDNDQLVSVAQFLCDRQAHEQRVLFRRRRDIQERQGRRPRGRVAVGERREVWPDDAGPSLLHALSAGGLAEGRGGSRGSHELTAC